MKSLPSNSPSNPNKKPITVRKIALLTAAGVLALLHRFLCNPIYELQYNASDSIPKGWYLRVPAHDLQIGDLVFVRLPSEPAKLAETRRYLPSTVPLLKHVAATGGHDACVHEGRVAVDGRAIGFTLTRDEAGRSLHAWNGCRPLERDEVFLFSYDNPTSFDSRYFGPVDVARIIGEAIPLWTW